MPSVPIETKGGTKIGPVAIICATLCFMVSAGLLVFLIGQYPDQADIYLRPLIPVLVTLGTGAILYLRSHKNNEDNKASHTSTDAKLDEAKELAGKAVENAEVAAANTQTVATRLNGDLDQRIEDAVTRALTTKKEEE